MRMVELGGFDIVGHADKMHYNASAYHPGLLDEPWYDALIQEYFDAIARKGYIVEINTKSYLELGTFYLMNATSLYCLKRESVYRLIVIPTTRSV